MNTLSYTVGDVRSQEYDDEKELRLIPHCCNNIPAMGAGVALALLTKWPEVKTQYMESPRSTNIGSVEMVNVDKTTFVANMIGQDGVVSADNPKPVKYLHLALAMHRMIGQVKVLTPALRDSAVIHCPKFGCGLAGGDWTVVEALIEEIWLPHFNVLVCCYDESELPDHAKP